VSRGGSEGGGEGARGACLKGVGKKGAGEGGWWGFVGRELRERRQWGIELWWGG